MPSLSFPILTLYDPPIHVTAYTQNFRVVCFGRDLELLRTRIQVLARTYDVVEVSSVDELEALAAEPAFDLVLLCHTLSPEECRASAELTQQRWPQAKVMVLITGASSARYEKADAVVMSIQGPAVLLQSIHQLMMRNDPSQMVSRMTN